MLAYQAAMVAAMPVAALRLVLAQIAKTPSFPVEPGGGENLPLAAGGATIGSPSCSLMPRVLLHDEGDTPYIRWSGCSSRDGDFLSTGSRIPFAIENPVHGTNAPAGGRGSIRVAFKLEPKLPRGKKSSPPNRWNPNIPSAIL